MTYREDKVFMYSKDDLKLTKTYEMPVEMIEGWGLTHDNENLYSSDGSHNIYTLDPETF
jgi:glutamine cyclotransferase